MSLFKWFISESRYFHVLLVYEVCAQGQGSWCGPGCTIQNPLNLKTTLEILYLESLSAMCHLRVEATCVC